MQQSNIVYFQSENPSFFLWSQFGCLSDNFLSSSSKPKLKARQSSAHVN